MTRHLVLLRGINLGSHRRVAMPALREVLAGAGFQEVRTYVQSGNVVLDSERPAREVAEVCEALIEQRFGFPVRVITRTREELAEVVARDPLGPVAEDPKRYQVTFLEAEPGPEARARLEAFDAEPDQLVVDGRELYTWHPAGIARSKLWARLARDGWLGVTATARNWTTVTTLLGMAEED